MDIGRLHLSSSPALALAPMAGYTDAAFRTLILSRGADMACSELTSASALAYLASGKKTSERAKTLSIIKSAAIEKSKRAFDGIQIFGSKPAEVEVAVNFILAKIDSGECHAKFIDINFGCPAPKVVRNGGGSALLQDMEKVKAIAEAAVDAASAGSLPVTAKIRLGYKTKNNVEIAQTIESSGISALTVHGRTAAQKFSGKSDWKSIGEVVRAVSIPVFGNGDVRTPQDNRAIIEESGCAGVMIGRAVLSNPNLFLQARDFLAKKKFEPITWNQKIEFLSEYIELMPRYDLPFHAALDLAIQLASGFRGSARLRGELMKAKSAEALLEKMEQKSAE